MITAQATAPDEIERAAGRDERAANTIRKRIRGFGERRLWTPGEHLVSNLATALLAVAALATSWSSYQASIWSGQQSTDYSIAGGLRNQASREYTQAGEERMIDIGLFNAWLEAYAQRQDTIAAFFHRRFRPEFATAFDAWLLTSPRNNPAAPPSPFQMADYRRASIARGEAIDRRADRVFADGQTANQNSDRYVFTAVIFASVLFFGGVAGQMGPIRARFSLLGLGAVLCIVGLVQLSLYPVMR